MRDSIDYRLKVDDRLATLGHEQADLLDALREGCSFKAELSPLDTTAFKGIGTWNAIVKQLADNLIKKGWFFEQPRHFAMLVNPDRTFSIAVMSGDSGTGSPDVTPRNTLSLKNRISVTQAIMNNRAVVYGTHFSSFDKSFPSPLKTYFLLHHIVDMEAGQFRAELSLAIGHSRKYIDRWHDRIILTPPAVEDPPMSIEEPIDVPIAEISA